jgi:hypothetical protein
MPGFFVYTTWPKWPIFVFHQDFPMKKLLLLPALAIMIACGNEKTDDHAGHDMSGHDHAAMEHSSEAVDTTGLGVSHPADARIFFANLTDGQEISLPFQLQMGVEGMEVEQAGQVNYGRGHHHLIIDGSFMAPGTSVPFDGQHLHFGKGQTEMTLDSLSSGEHTLTLQFANGAHLSYGENLSATIKIKVK